MATSIAAPSPEQTIRLLDYDPELGEDLRPERRDEARASALATMLVVPRGPWTGLRPDMARSCPYGALVLDGLVSRTVLLGGGDASTQLLGRGDLLRPEGTEPGETLVRVDVRWTVLEPITLALLGERFLLTVRRWPEIVAALFDRIAAQSARIGTHRALCQLQRVEDRIHALLWFLAERWGRVTPQGVILPLKLTHELLGQLVGAKRSTVTLAIKELESRGTVHRRGDGAWLLEQRWERETGNADEVEHASASFVRDVAPAPTPVLVATPSRAEPGPPAAAPAPGPDVDAISSLLAMRRRVERLRDRHSRSVGEVDSVLSRCIEAQQRSAALRDRLARGRGSSAA